MTTKTLIILAAVGAVVYYATRPRGKSDSSSPLFDLLSTPGDLNDQERAKFGL